MNTNLFNILKQIITKEGENILAEPHRLKPLVNAHAKGEPKEDRVAFGRAIESSFYTDLKHSSPRDRSRVKASLVPRLQIMTGYDESRCAAAIDLLEAVMFAPAQSGQPPQPRSPQPTYQAPPPNQNYQPQYVSPQLNTPPNAFCGNCGMQVSSGSLFCNNCGNKVGSQSTAKRQRPQGTPPPQPSSPQPQHVPPPQPTQTSPLSVYKIVGRIGFALIIFGFFMPIACRMNGFEMANGQIQADEGNTIAGLLFYVLLISAIVGVILGTRWDVLIACIGSGIGAYFLSGMARAVDLFGHRVLDTGAYLIFTGWIVALITQILSEYQKE